MSGRRRRWRAGVVGLSAVLTLGGVGPAGAAASGAGQPEGGPNTVGQWAEPFQESGGGGGPVAVEAAVLGDGRVMYLEGTESGTAGSTGATRSTGSAAGSGAAGQARLLDLRSDPARWATPAQQGDLSCSDLTALPDGKVLLAGGGTWLFDPSTDRFAPAAPMHQPRWYPQLVAGPDGNPTAFGGVIRLPDDLPGDAARRTETYDAASGTWAENYAGPASEATLPPEPRMVLAPNGQFFYAAAGQMWGPFRPSTDEARTALFQFFDPKNKRWTAKGLAPLGARSGAFVVPLTLEPPYDHMTLVTGGGVLGPTPGAWLAANGYTTLTSIDANGEVTNDNAGDLQHARWHGSGVLLPDGQILAVGGADKDSTVVPGVARPVLTPELYDPVSGRWREMAPQRQARGYHHSALLLPDMRVLLGGGDGDRSFEIWSPPYLFRGPRPTVTAVPPTVNYGEPFTVDTPDADLVESVLLLRTPSPGHANDSDQRALKLEFSRRGPQTLLATAPPSGRVAPPGTYYLVVNKRSLQGPIPSVARTVVVGRTGP
jgi:hypothetical protein